MTNGLETRILVTAAVLLLATSLASTAEELAVPVYSSAQAKSGEKVYLEHCSTCHGSKLNNGMTDGAPALIGAGFVQQWGQKSLDELYTFTSTSMPLDAPRSLSPSTYASIIAFLLSRNGVAPGLSELPSDVSKLRKLSGPK